MMIWGDQRSTTPLTDVLLNGLLGNHSLGHEEVDERLQRFHVLLGDQVVVHGHSHEVDEARIQLGGARDVPEWFFEMAVIQVSVASKHLLDDALDILMEVLREAG